MSQIKPIQPFSQLSDNPEKMGKDIYSRVMITTKHWVQHELMLKNDAEAISTFW